MIAQTSLDLKDTANIMQMIPFYLKLQVPVEEEWEAGSGFRRIRIMWYSMKCYYVRKISWCKISSQLSFEKIDFIIYRKLTFLNERNSFSPSFSLTLSISSCLSFCVIFSLCIIHLFYYILLCFILLLIFLRKSIISTMLPFLSWNKNIENKLQSGFLYPANIYLFKVNNKKTRKRFHISSKLTVKTLHQGHWCLPGIFVVNFEHISHFS